MPLSRDMTPCHLTKRRALLSEGSSLSARESLTALGVVGVEVEVIHGRVQEGDLPPILLGDALRGTRRATARV